MGRIPMSFCSTQRAFHFEIIINVLVSSYRSIWIPMLLIYGHSKCFKWTDLRCQNLTSTDVRFWRLNSVPALKGWTDLCLQCQIHVLMTWPSNTTNWTNVRLMLGQRLRRWPNINLPLAERVVWWVTDLVYLQSELSGRPWHSGGGSAL